MKNNKRHKIEYARYDCQNGVCPPYNANTYITNDYPYRYSGSGQPPSGMNPYIDVNNPKKALNYYKRIRSTVPYNPNIMYPKNNNPSKNNKQRYAQITSIPIYENINTGRPEQLLDYKYTDGRYNIYTTRDQAPVKYIKTSDNTRTRFEDKGSKYSPRWLGWKPKLKEKAMKYYYLPYLKKDTDVESIPYEQYMYHIKYATPEENKQLLKAYNNKVLNYTYQPPYNFVEWNGRLWDCSKLPKRPDKLCSESVYVNTPMAKCQAQHKFLQRTEGGHCSLNGNLPPNIDFAKSVQLIHDIEDADKQGLLLNNPIEKKNCCNRINTWDVPSYQDYWTNYSYNPQHNIKWNEIGSKIKRGF
jgi:hypothetical protein